MLSQGNLTPQAQGYKNFFTNNYDGDIIAIQFARQNAKLNANRSNPYAIEEINNTYFPGPMHFANTSFIKEEGKRFFDLDLKSAYPTWLLNYARGNFGYKIGGTKEYYHNLSYFSYDKGKGVKVYKFKFAVKTRGKEKASIYRRWFLKTTKVKNITMTNEIITGYISIPDIEGLPNRFINEVQAYEDHVIEIHSIIKTSGSTSIYINEDNIAKAMRLKNSNNPLSSEYKMMLNSSTGYLSIADKILYYTMVNHIRAVLFKLIDYIEEWNVKRPEDKIDIVAANTDGITIYADKELELILESILEFEFNQYSCFKFNIKDVYTLDEAKFTPNDIRKDVN